MLANKRWDERVLIPYQVHYIWLTDPDDPQVMPYENVWEAIRTLNRDIAPWGFNPRLSFNDYHDTGIIIDVGGQAIGADMPEKYEIQWKYTFWTNHRASVKLDEEAC